MLVFYIFKITYNVPITEHNSEITNPINECQFNKNKLNFDDCFDSDDEVMSSIISCIYVFCVNFYYIVFQAFFNTTDILHETINSSKSNKDRNEVDCLFYNNTFKLCSTYYCPNYYYLYC